MPITSPARQGVKLVARLGTSSGHISVPQPPPNDRRDVRGVGSAPYTPMTLERVNLARPDKPSGRAFPFANSAACFDGRSGLIPSALAAMGDMPPTRTNPSLLSELPEHLSANLFNSATPVKLNADAVLFLAGDAGDGCYRIDDGLLKVTMVS